MQSRSRESRVPMSTSTAHMGRHFFAYYNRDKLFILIQNIAVDEEQPGRKSSGWRSLLSSDAEVKDHENKDRSSSGLIHRLRGEEMESAKNNRNSLSTDFESRFNRASTKYSSGDMARHDYNDRTTTGHSQFEMSQNTNDRSRAHKDISTYGYREHTSQDKHTTAESGRAGLKGKVKQINNKPMTFQHNIIRTRQKVWIQYFYPLLLQRHLQPSHQHYQHHLVQRRPGPPMHPHHLTHHMKPRVQTCSRKMWP